MRFIHRLFIAVSLLLASHVEAIACELVITAPSSVRYFGPDGQGYDSFTTALFDADFFINFENSGTERCEGLAALRSIDGQVALAGYQGVNLSYEVLGLGANQNVVVPAGTPLDLNRAILLALDPGQRQDVRFRFRVTPQQIVPAGTYNQSVSIEFQQIGADGLVSERQMDLATTVRSSMSIMLYRNAISSGSGGQQGRALELDFDRLETGEQMSVSVLVLSNDPYTMRFLSDNGGVLAHTTLGRQVAIPYELTLDGRIVVPNGAIAGAVGTRRATTLSGETSVLAVKIGNVGLARAGTYEDVLTLTIQPD